MTASMAVFILFFYPLLSVIAAMRTADHSVSILLINLLFGWTVVGWIAALIWSVVEKPWELEPRTPSALTG
jgi:hypothetical protein